MDEPKSSAVLSEFARTLTTDFPIQGILDHLVVRIVDLLPITAAGVTLIADGMPPRYIAAADADALRFERLQTELGEGPCLAAYRTGKARRRPQRLTTLVDRSRRASTEEGSRLDRPPVGRVW